MRLRCVTMGLGEASPRLVDVRLISTLGILTICLCLPHERAFGRMKLRITTDNDIALSVLWDVDDDIIIGSHLIAVDAQCWTLNLL